MAVPKKYQHIAEMKGLPLITQEMFAEYGRTEGLNNVNNPTIIKWADEVYETIKTPYTKWAADWYNSDEVPWCGLFAAAMVCRAYNKAGVKDPLRLPPDKYLSALAWANFGIPVQFKGREGLRLNEILLGDMGVFVRKGGGHIADIIAVSTDGKQVYVLGGNQQNGVNIVPISISRLYAVRRPPYKIQPAGAKHIRMAPSGVVSDDER